MSGKVD